MKNYRKHIDDFFREKLGRYRETPPADVWDSLDARLDTLLPKAPGAYRWLNHFGIVSLILILSVPVVRRLSGNAIQQKVVLHDQTIAAAKVAAPAINTSAGGPAPAEVKGMPAAEGNASTAAGKEPHDKNNAALLINNVAPSRSAARFNGNALPRKSIAMNKKQQGNQLHKDQGQQENIYNGTAEKPGPMADNLENEKSGVPTTQVAATNKTQSQKLPAAMSKSNAEGHADGHKKEFHAFEAGVKVGYERGFNDLVATKYVLAPFLQYNLSSRFAVMTQPAIKSAKTNIRKFGKTASYYKVNNDGTVTQDGASTPNIIFEGGVGVDTTYNTTYTYRQTHDSIAKSYITGGSYVEYELPVLLKYSLVRGLSVYGGVNLVYSKSTTITENTYTQSGIGRTVSVSNSGQEIPQPLPLNQVITYSGTEYANQAPLYTTRENKLRFGYMVGFSYEYCQRWMFDGLMLQTPVKPDIQKGYTTNSTMSAPYFRMTVGYKITR